VKKLIEFILTSIVTKPKKVKITKSATESGFTQYIAQVDPEDMGKVIGKGGKIIHAIRTLIKTKALKENKKVLFTLQED
jgi:predicted RNA-binding protein YlqC (UPF0109 family)